MDWHGMSSVAAHTCLSHVSIALQDDKSSVFGALFIVRIAVGFLQRLIQHRDLHKDHDLERQPNEREGVTTAAIIQAPGGGSKLSCGMHDLL